MITKHEEMSRVRGRGRGRNVCQSVSQSVWAEEWHVSFAPFEHFGEGGGGAAWFVSPQSQLFPQIRSFVPQSPNSTPLPAFLLLCVVHPPHLCCTSYRHSGSTIPPGTLLCTTYSVLRTQLPPAPLPLLPFFPLPLHLPDPTSSFSRSLHPLLVDPWFVRLGRGKN